MTREQFLLLKLAEECQEVAQRALKQIQFGANQIQTGKEVKDGVPAPDKDAGLTNGQRLRKEVLDLVSLIHLLEEAKQIPWITWDEFDDARTIKIEKLNRYLTLSRALGEIDGEWTV